MAEVPIVSISDVSVSVTTESNEITPTTSGEQSYTLSSDQIQNLNIESRSAIELLDLIRHSFQLCCRCVQNLKLFMSG